MIVDDALRALPSLAPALPGGMAREELATLTAAWLERAGPIGERLGVHAGHDRLEGTFLDLDTDGGLIIRDLHGLQRKLIYGDVTLGASQPPESEGR